MELHTSAPLLISTVLAIIYRGSEITSLWWVLHLKVRIFLRISWMVGEKRASSIIIITSCLTSYAVPLRVHEDSIALGDKKPMANQGKKPF